MIDFHIFEAELQRLLSYIFFQVSWVRHDDVSLISVGKLKYIKDERFRIINEDHSDDWVLAIRYVRLSTTILYCSTNFFDEPIGL